jgi:hypothetical protein
LSISEAGFRKPGEVLILINRFPASFSSITLYFVLCLLLAAADSKTYMPGVVVIYAGLRLNISTDSNFMFAGY